VQVRIDKLLGNLVCIVALVSNKAVAYRWSCCTCVVVSGGASFKEIGPMSPPSPHPKSQNNKVSIYFLSKIIFETYNRFLNHLIQVIKYY
jgi:hypothetical protein